MRSEKDIEKKLMGNFDAKIWAEEFVKIVKEKPEISSHEQTMLGWFANAIMAGYDHAKKELEGEPCEGTVKKFKYPKTLRPEFPPREIKGEPRYSVSELEKILVSEDFSIALLQMNKKPIFNVMFDFLKDKKKVQEILK